MLIADDVSLYILVKEPVVGYSLRFGDPSASPNSCCAEFSGVESLSDLIDGDPPESMRLGKQGSPSLWQARRPSVGEAG